MSRRGSARRRLGALATPAVVLVVLLGAACAAPRGTPPRGATRIPSTTGAPGAAVSDAWTEVGGGPSRQGADLADPPRTAAPQTAWVSPTLDGAVYGQPLVFDATVLVGSENDTVYAFGEGDGSARWSRHLAQPAAAGQLPCGDIAPTVGITSTMVVDPATGVLYVSAETGGAGAVGHELFALDARSGALLWSRGLDQPGWDPAAQLQRTGLGLAEGNVLVGFGGNYGDCGEYHGWLVAVPESGRGPTLTYQVPTTRQGGVWAPGGVAVDAAGHVFVATGNGAGPAAASDRADAVVALGPGLAETQFFLPRSFARDNAADADLGSTAPVLLGGGRIFQVGKQATGYLLDAGNLGGLGGALASVSVCTSAGAVAYGAPDLYVPCPDEGTLTQVVVTRDTLQAGWRWHSPTGQASSPMLAGGVLWCVDPAAGALYGIDPADGTTRYRVALSTGTLPHFATPSAAGGLLFVAGDRHLEALR